MSCLMLDDVSLSRQIAFERARAELLIKRTAAALQVLDAPDPQSRFHPLSWPSQSGASNSILRTESA